MTNTRLTRAAVAVLLGLMAGHATAAETPKRSPDAAPTLVPASPIAPAPTIPVTTGAGPAPTASPGKSGLSDAQTYCQNIASAAADARFARESKALNLLQGQIQQRIADLEAKEVEYREILARHDEAQRRANAGLVAIYAQMKPDAAATQLSALDDPTAAAVLSLLKPSKASAILNEITPERAVRLVNAIALQAPQDDKKS